MPAAGNSSLSGLEIATSLPATVISCFAPPFATFAPRSVSGGVLSVTLCGRSSEEGGSAAACDAELVVHFVHAGDLVGGLFGDELHLTRLHGAGERHFAV